MDRARVVREELDEGATKLLNELRLSLDYYGAQEGALPIERIVVCGTGSTMPGLVERLQGGLTPPIEARTPAALSHLDGEDAARLDCAREVAATRDIVRRGTSAHRQVGVYADAVDDVLTRIESEIRLRFFEIGKMRHKMRPSPS